MIKRSLALKIGLALLGVMAVIVGIVMWVSVNQITDMLTKRVKMHLKDVGKDAVRMVQEHEEYINSLKVSMIDTQKHKITSVVESALSIAEYYYDKFQAGELTEEEAKKQALNSISAIRYDDGAGYVFINDSNGVIVYNPKRSIIGKNLWDISDKNGVKFVQELTKAAKNGGGFVTYLWPKPGSDVPQPKLSYAMYFKPWDWVIGTGIYIDDVEKAIKEKEKELWEQFRKNLLSVKFGENSYPAIVAEDGTVILYIKKELEGKKVQFKDAKTGEDLIKKFMENKNSFVEYYYTKPGSEGVYKKLAYVGYIPSKKWLVLLTMYEDEAFAGMKKLSLIVGTMMVVGAVIVMVLFWIMLKIMLVKALDKVGEFSEKVGSGDLTVELTYMSEDEIGKLAKIVDNMKNDFLAMVEKIKEAGGDVERKSEDIESIADRMSEKIDEVAKSVEKTVTMANNVAESVEESTSGVEEVASSAQMVSNTAEELSQQSAYLREAVEEGETALDTISKRIEMVANESRSAAESVKQLADSTKNIEKIVETISSIAEQTNLLALNAAIEAARAGEAGKGFAVVADEIRKLAEESRKSTEQIASILGNIRQEAAKVSEITTKLADMIQGVHDKSDNISVVFSKIKEQTTSLDSMTNNLAASAQEQSAAAEEISASMDTAAHAVNDVVSEVQNIRQKMSELEEEKNILVEASDTLAKLVDILNDAISKFKTKK